MKKKLLSVWDLQGKTGGYNPSVRIGILKYPSWSRLASMLKTSKKDAEEHYAQKLVIEMSYKRLRSIAITASGT